MTVITSFENIRTFDDLLDAKYGPAGTPARTAFDANAEAFRTGEMLKEARRQAKLTQQQLADRTGTKKAISRASRTAIPTSTWPHCGAS